ncbi:methylcobamide:CoM methyltransferase MtaA [Methanolobus sp. WCC4]|uniref:methylcobamide:CoM methyltransferase MtaA n=1 Tax=Methanolobus sp. WCC4 TaxID=3125784 RepID=UPI0030FA5AC9
MGNSITQEKDVLRKRFNDILKGKGTDIPPVGTVTTSPVLELMDIIGAERPEADRVPEKMAQLTSSLHSVSKFEIIRFPFDVTVLAEALGCGIDPGTKARTPAVVSHPFKDRFKEQADMLDVHEELLDKGRIPVVLRTCEILRENKELNAPIVAGIEGPADLAASICGIKPFLKWTIKKPELVTAIVNRCVDACILYANACLDHGADAVVIADATSSPDMMGPDAFRKLMKNEYSRLADSIQGNCISHICGRTDNIIPDLLDCGFNALSIEENVGDLRHIIAQAHEENIAVIGNISTSDTLINKSAAEVKSEARKCLESGIDILAPGCGIAPETPLRNLLAMAEARDEYIS